ncbi:MAG: class I SAM-dependent methyltransferase [Thermoleophilia bacterium]|nr:class I SAM-dependent methyltransferase [Thermoleophilia bacterium]
MADERLERWLDELLRVPGLTAIRDREEARRALLEDSLRGAELVRRFEGPVVDVGSGGGAPGIPLAVVLPEREVVLLEAQRRKCDFLERVGSAFPNVRVVWGRAEEQPADVFGVAVVKALAPPPVAAEWSLPLVRPGGAAILWVGPSVDVEAVARAATQLGAGEPQEHDGLLMLPKLRPTPPGFPRRPGIARKRPLA